MTSLVSGACLCGALRFSVALPARWVAHCHCSRCQRAHGAAFVTWVGLLDEAVDIVNPHGVLTWYQAAEASRGFCSRCGSPLFFKSPRYPGELHIARAAFTNELAQLPECNVFYDTHALWAERVESLPCEDDPEWSQGGIDQPK